jgi:hypothetical protein
MFMRTRKHFVLTQKFAGCGVGEVPQGEKSGCKKDNETDRSNYSTLKL